ncbi:MAG: WG repeat-containing protein [Christensenellales bacterium]
MKKIAALLLAALMLAGCGAPAKQEEAKEAVPAYGSGGDNWPRFAGKTDALVPVYTESGMALMDAQETLVTGGDYTYLDVLSYTDENGAVTETPYTLAQYQMEDGSPAYTLFDELGLSIDDIPYESIEMLSPTVIALQYHDLITLMDVERHVIHKDLSYFPRVINDTIITTYENESFQAYDLQGKPLFTDKNWNNIGGMSENLMSVSVDDLWGYCSLDGNTVIEPQFAAAGDFHEGIAPVSLDGDLWGYMDSQGKLLTEQVYTECGNFEGGVAYVSRDGSYGVINKDMVLISGIAYDYAEMIGHGFCLVHEGDTDNFILYDRNGVVDTKGVMVAGALGGDRLITLDGALYGLCSLSFETVVKPRYTDIQPVGGNAIVIEQVNKAGMYAFVDKDGREILPPVYQSIEEYRGFYMVVRGAYYGYVDNTSSWVVKFSRCTQLVD